MTSVRINTTLGEFVVEMYTQHAPRTCRNFTELASQGYYNNTVFHRVIRDFMIQGGDPTGTVRRRSAVGDRRSPRRALRRHPRRHPRTHPFTHSQTHSPIRAPHRDAAAGQSMVTSSTTSPTTSNTSVPASSQWQTPDPTPTARSSSSHLRHARTSTANTRCLAAYPTAWRSSSGSATSRRTETTGPRKTSRYSTAPSFRLRKNLTTITITTSCAS